jgi:hypothetical protein
MWRLLIPCAILLLAGCDGWPLYLNLPTPEAPTAEPDRLDVTADPDAASGEVQELGAITAPTVVSIAGASDFCGFDSAADADWPVLPVDSNGDGIADEELPHHTGWYDGDVDVFGVEAETAGWLHATLQWTAAPEGQNRPIDLNDPTGPWSEETDLDLVVLDWDGDATGAVLNDQGVSLGYPEETGQVLDLEAGERVALAVACHHGEGGGYALRLELRVP